MLSYIVSKLKITRIQGLAKIGEQIPQINVVHMLICRLSGQTHRPPASSKRTNIVITRVVS